MKSAFNKEQRFMIARTISSHLDDLEKCLREAPIDWTDRQSVVEEFIEDVFNGKYEDDE